jgi:outer membrane protein assembly factor BamE (lipoprotein component of BamABCDE complex)
VRAVAFDLEPVTGRLAMRQRRLAALLTLAGFLVSCASAFQSGRDFPSPKPGAEIKNGATAKADLLKMFGEPTQVGTKDGDQTWTWYFFKKGTGSGPDLTKQLEVTFNAQNVVKSYSFSSNFPDDMKNR